MAKNPASMLVPGDYEVEQEALLRKQKLLEGLMAQGMESPRGQMVSGHYVAPSWTEQLAPLAKMAASLYGQKKLDEKKEVAKNNYQTGLGEALEKYLQTREGQSGQIAPTEMQDGQTLPGMQLNSTPDPRKAVIEAMASQYAPLRQIGAAEFMQMGKKPQGLTQKDILMLAGDKYSPESVRKAAMSGDISQLEAPVKTHVVNGQLVREDGSGGSKQTGDYRDRFNGVGPVGYDAAGKPIMGQVETGTGKAAFAPAQGTTVNVDTGKKGADAFATHAGEAAVKDLVTSTEEARKAQKGFETFANAKTQLTNVKGGSGAELILSAKKIAQQLGVPLDDSISSIEQVQAALGQGVLDNAKSLGSGSGFSNTDREFLEKIVLGKISLDESSLKRAVNLGLAANLNTLRNHENKLVKAQGIQGADPAVLDQFQVPVPGYSLNAEEFNYDPSTRRVTVQSHGGGGKSPLVTPAAPTNAKSELTTDEQAERAMLRKKLGLAK